MKKIIALIVSLTVIFSILNISAFALDLNEAEDSGWHDSGETIMTSQEYYAAQSHLIDKFCSGEITFSQYQEQSQVITDKYLILHTDPVSGALEAGALNASNDITAISKKIGSIVQQWGDDARQRVSDWWNGVTSDVPTETVQTPTTDINGYGVKLVINSSTGLEIWYGDYVILYENPDYFRPMMYGGLRFEKYTYDKNTNTNVLVSVTERDGTAKFSGTSLEQYIENINSGYMVLTGDVRAIADSPALPEYAVGTIESTTKKFDDLPAPDLDNILDDFSEELERQNPDLSTIEGLLKAIYARMGKLDSDNDNQLLAAINANILKLINADKDKDDNEDNTNEELVNTLLEIRDALKEGTFGTAPEAHGHEISGTLYNVIPLDKNFLNKLFHNAENLKVEYEGKVYYLEDCGCLKLGDKYYTPNMNYDSYAFADYDFSNENISIDTDKYVNFDFTNYNDVSAKLTFSQRKKIDNIVDLIYKMVSQAVPYAAITSAFAPFEVIIFNTAVPDDIVLNFNGTGDIGGFSATILSVSFFQNQYVAAAMGIVKPFLTVVIGYCWLKVMRRKAVSMLG